MKGSHPIGGSPLQKGKCTKTTTANFKGNCKSNCKSNLPYSSHHDGVLEYKEITPYEVGKYAFFVVLVAPRRSVS